MCLIIASEFGELPDRKLFENAFEDNNDGFGVVWAEGGKLRTYKTFRLRKALKFLPNLEGHPFVMHFRFATHGRVDIDNTHPFKVTRHLFMAHNGIIDWAAVNKSERSDSWHFSRLVADTLRDDQRAEAFALLLPTIETIVGAHNKLAFLRSDGKLFIANEDAGVMHDGLWLSNPYSLPGRRHAATRWPAWWDDISSIGTCSITPASGWATIGQDDDEETDPPIWASGHECDSCNAWCEAGHAKCTVDGVSLYLCRQCHWEFFGEAA